MTDNLISLENEIWKPVLGYEGLYEVSNFGRVKSIDRTIKHINDFTCIRQGKIKTPYIRKDGYLTVSLSRENKIRNPYIHRLAMEAFFGKSNLHIDHRNGDIKNNYLYNLEYVTPRENIRRGSRTKDIGVRKIKNSWVVYLRLADNKSTYFGSYKNKELAIEARNKALLENNIPLPSNVKNTDFV